jgi:hypothetical protein
VSVGTWQVRPAPVASAMRNLCTLRKDESDADGAAWDCTAMSDDEDISADGDEQQHAGHRKVTGYHAGWPCMLW